MRTDFEKLHILNHSFRKAIEQKAINEDSVNDSYHIAQKFLKDSLQRAYLSESHKSKSLLFFRKGGTLLLKELFSELKLDESKLPVFNALSLIDQVSIDFCNG